MGCVIKWKFFYEIRCWALPGSLGRSVCRVQNSLSPLDKKQSNCISTLDCRQFISPECFQLRTNEPYHNLLSRLGRRWPRWFKSRNARQYVFFICFSFNRPYIIEYLTLFALSGFLQREDCNFISVDWRFLALPPVYPKSAANVQPVGELTGKLINFLISQGADRLKFHLLGFSLGAHVVGRAGLTATDIMPRITGLILFGIRRGCLMIL